MANLKLGLNRKNPQTLIDMGDAILAKQAPAAPPGGGPPPPPLVAGLDKETADFKLAHKNLAAAVDAYIEMSNTLGSLLEQRNAAKDVYQRELENYANLLSSKVKGDPAVLANLGLELAGARSRTEKEPDRVLNLQVTQADDDGALDGQHDVPEGAKSYEIQLTTVHPVDGPYTTVEVTTSSSWKLKGLTSGQRVWVRVRAVGPNGKGPWSDPATKIVP